MELRTKDIKSFLDKTAERFNHPNFIEQDPISIPHRFTNKQDIEIAGLFAATLAWGQRKTIIIKCNELMNMMGNTPHNFVVHHTNSDLKSFAHFKHRTFNGTDVLYFIEFLKTHYEKNKSLETLFKVTPNDATSEQGLIYFHKTFFGLPDYPIRTKKHVSTPEKNSACKRLNMYLRWMVRNDNKGVDFGLWKSISPAQLVCPLDVHVERIARNLKLISRKQVDWYTALELTSNLKKLNPHDPVKYDFALFGLGISKADY